MNQHFIQIVEGAGKGDIFEIKEIIEIGRSNQNDVTISNPDVSRRHARIIREKNRCILEDIRSSHGTYVNRARITSHTLNENDLIQIGNTVLEFQISHEIDKTQILRKDPAQANPRQPTPTQSTQASPDSFSPKLTSQIPETLRAKIVKYGLAESFEPIRRTLTVLHCEILELSPLGAEMHEQNTQEIIQLAYRMIKKEVFKCSGVFLFATGSSCIATWGAPIIELDQGELCLRAALAIRKASAEIKTSFDSHIRIGMGVAKEDGTCGIIGEGDDSFYSVVGMCREIAEELATRANAGQILANRNLHDSNRMFQYKTMSSFPLKGRPETIDFSEVLS